ncbi:MAG: hypothetical protein WD648_11695 [Planctomycetaceae bacterium]
MVFATFDREFQPLSDRHERLIAESDGLLKSYADGDLEHPTYVVIGTFGAGKTQFLYRIFRTALDLNLLPVLFLAEDLLTDVIRTDSVYTQGDVANLVEKKLQVVTQILQSRTGDYRQKLESHIDPRRTHAPLLDALLIALGDSNATDKKPVLLVDELEGQYKTLQEKVHTLGDRSPLRELFEAPYLKFFALAPAGIYEMGGADQTRALRLVIPAADVTYVRSRLGVDHKRANSCWWLSRGKARHLFKACEQLRDLPESLTAPRAARILREQFDHIGQHPTEVPPAVIEHLSPTKVPSLLNLAPENGGAIRCYHIDVGSLDEGKLADHIADAFGLPTDVAVLFAEYFRATLLALSDNNYRCFVPDNELPEAMSLALDHLLEYEYGNPTLSEHMGQLLGLYERIVSDHAAVHGTIGRQWEAKQAETILPLTMSEVRRAFPFPLMNPIVKGHDPLGVKDQREGKGAPLWKWNHGNTLAYFFLSNRDFEEFLVSDEFLTAVLKDGSGVLCMLPSDAGKRTPQPIENWCNQNGKLSVAVVPQLLSDFLLSGAGELGDVSPGDLNVYVQRWTTDKDDVLLSRKAEIYSAALFEIASGSAPEPRIFFKEPPPDADNVWGSSRVADRSLAVAALSVAWADWTPKQKELLVQLRDLFRSGKDGKGRGDLNKLVYGTGLAGIADDILPRYGRTKQLIDAPATERIQRYWVGTTKEYLIALMRLCPRDQVVRLAPSEDHSRLVESLWRAIRGDFNFGDRSRALTEYARNIRDNIIPVLESARDLEDQAKTAIGVTGIDFEDYEGTVKALDGFQSLLKIADSCLSQPDTSGFPVLRALLELFCRGADVDHTIRKLGVEGAKAKASIEKVDRISHKLVQNYWECPKAVAYLGLSSDDTLRSYVQKERVYRYLCSLESLQRKAEEIAGNFEEVMSNLNRLEGRLDELKELLQSADEE